MRKTCHISNVFHHLRFGSVTMEDNQRSTWDASRRPNKNLPCQNNFYNNLYSMMLAHRCTAHSSVHTCKQVRMMLTSFHWTRSTFGSAHYGSTFTLIHKIASVRKHFMLALLVRMTGMTGIQHVVCNISQPRHGKDLCLFDGLIWHSDYLKILA